MTPCARDGVGRGNAIGHPSAACRASGVNTDAKGTAAGSDRKAAVIVRVLIWIVR
jgi:hypothetical protein